MFIGFLNRVWLHFVFSEMMPLKTSMFNWWPEAESNCRPLVFQIWANLLTLIYYILFSLSLRSLLTVSRSQWVVSKTELYSELVKVLRCSRNLLGIFNQFFILKFFKFSTICNFAFSKNKISSSNLFLSNFISLSSNI
jgi:hypothetical protein